MNRLLTVGCIVATLATAPVAAEAADAGRPPYRAPLAVIYDWTGFYLGAHVGFASTDGDSGFIGGGQAGFNYQVGQWVFGAEWQMSGTSISESRTVEPFRVEASLDWISTLAGRAGIAFDQWLVYGKLGAAWAHGSGGLSIGNFCVCGSDTISGWMFGLGTEYALRNNWSVKLEYNMLEFDPGTIHSVKGGVNYRFGLDPRRY